MSRVEWPLRPRPWRWEWSTVSNQMKRHEISELFVICSRCSGRSVTPILFTEGNELDRYLSDSSRGQDGKCGYPNQSGPR